MRIIEGKVKPQKGVTKKHAIFETTDMTMSLDVDAKCRKCLYKVKAHKGYLTPKDCDSIVRLLFWACDGQDPEDVDVTTVDIAILGMAYRGTKNMTKEPGVPE